MQTSTANCKDILVLVMSNKQRVDDALDNCSSEINDNGHPTIFSDNKYHFIHAAKLTSCDSFTDVQRVVVTLPFLPCETPLSFIPHTFI